MTVEPGGAGTPMSERMQSLLSRAVEDQLSEQRQIAGVLADVRAQLQRITADVATLRSAPQDGREDVEAVLATVSGDVREAVRLLGERLDGVARLVQQRGNDLAELRAATAELHAAVRKHGEALAELTGGLAALPSFGERIAALQEGIGTLREGIGGLDHLSETVTSLQPRIEGVDIGLRELRSAFAAVGARMAELPGRADVEAAGARSAAPLADLGERLTGLERAMAALTQAVAAEPEPAGSDDRVADLRAELARFASATGEDAAALREHMGDRIGGLEAKVGEVVAMLTAEEPEAGDAATDADDVEDPVLTELAELREALLGDDGLAARIEAATTDDVDVKVASAVEQAVAASEQRLSAHIDEAVLALAEALLRRRPARSGPRPDESVPLPAAMPAADVLPPGPQAQEAEEESEPEPTSEPHPAGSPQAGSPQAGSPQAVAPWQTPPPAAEVARESAPDDSRRRRPWWRPGD
jgi:prefoldin subunit 5